MVGNCRTRDLKLARHLQRVAPDIVAPTEPAEGFGSLLQSSDPMLRFQLRDLMDRGKLPAVTAAVSVPLFSGTMKVAALSVRAGGRTYSLAASDVDTAVTYATLAAPSISRYASQYGPNAVSIDRSWVTYSPVLKTPRFNDSILRGWVNAIAQDSKLPAGASAVIILNPPGVVNTDADASTGVLGYHSLANLPYAFVNVLGPNLAVDDASGRYALALSHEIAELVVDPRADTSNPEVCDSCSGNCGVDYRNYFDSSGKYLESDSTFPPKHPYGFFINAIVQPASATVCPAPPPSCAYGPP